MANVINNPNLIYIPAQRGKMQPSTGGRTDGVFRLPTDPVFYADFTLTNVIVGSSYWIADSSNLSNILASGTAATSTVVVTGMASYNSPTMLVTVRVRYSSGGTVYIPFETQAFHQKVAAGSYIIQTLDPTA